MSSEAATTRPGDRPSGRKVILDGTHRDRTAEATWALIEPRLRRYGITRVADVTGLDCIGIPVYVAVRPLARSLSVSQGKGASPVLAKVSAAMESIELWHAENVTLETVRCTSEILREKYPIESLAYRVPSELLRDMTLDWCQGTGILSGDAIPIPRDIVSMDFSPKLDWDPAVFNRSSNGLASGNTAAEARLHALYEIVERDVTSSEKCQNARRFIDPASIPSAHIADWMNRLSDASASLEVAILPNDYGIPTATAFVWSRDFPVLFGGAGTHSDPVVAVSRAISEAVQSRLTIISGTRDDIPSSIDAFTVERDAPTFETGDPWADVVGDSGLSCPSIAEELGVIALRVATVTGYEPIAVDLSTDPDAFAVVKVVCPGLTNSRKVRYARHRTVPTRSAAERPGAKVTSGALEHSSGYTMHYRFHEPATPVDQYLHVYLHGASRFKSLFPPVFSSRIHSRNATESFCLFLADPIHGATRSTSCGWYLLGEDEFMPQVYQLVDTLLANHGLRGVVWHGFSSGGYAALRYCSHRDGPGLAFTVAPHDDPKILSVYTAEAEPYLQAEGYGATETTSALVGGWSAADGRALYAVVSERDTYFAMAHLRPLLAAAAQNAGVRAVVLRNGLGHGAISDDDYDSQLRTAIQWWEQILDSPEPV